VPIVSTQQYLLSLLDDLPMPGDVPNARAYVTPPDPRIQAKIPAIYIWPADGDENRTEQLGGTIPRNTGPGTASGTKGIMHRFDVYLTWFSSGSGPSQDPKFPGMVDALMFALRFSPEKASLVDPNTGLTSSVYNIGETLTYRTGIESTADERTKRYDALIQVDIWELINA
jgi:hypothetical protein